MFSCTTKIKLIFAPEFDEADAGEDDPTVFIYFCLLSFLQEFSNWIQPQKIRLTQFERLSLRIRSESESSLVQIPSHPNRSFIISPAHGSLTPPAVLRGPKREPTSPRKAGSALELSKVSPNNNGPVTVSAFFYFGG